MLIDMRFGELKSTKKQELQNSKLLINDVSFKQILLSIALHPFKLGRLLLSASGTRYISLTPYVLSKQIIYDRRERVWLTVFIRNYIDWITLTQIYVNDDYGTIKLKRHNDIYSFYKDNKNNEKRLLIIDCGGNIGLASRYFSEQYNNAEIVCIEPDPSNIRQAQINNSDKNVTFINAAVGAVDGVGTIIDTGLGNNAYQILLSKNGETKIVSINSTLQQYSPDKYIFFIMKIDIEGFEDDLFASNLEWIDQFPLLIIELHDWMFPRKGKSRNFLNAIAKLDRDFVYIGENVFSISNKLI